MGVFIVAVISCKFIYQNYFNSSVISIHIKIFLKNPYNKTHTLEIDETDTIRTLFVVINNIVDIPTKFFYLTYSGKVIGPESYNHTLVHFDIKKESTLHFHIRSTVIHVYICPVNTLVKKI